MEMVAGWLDSTVGEVIDTHRAVFAELPYVLIRSIDSETGAAVARMPWALQRQGQHPGWALSVDPLVISGASLVDLLGDDNLFTGFDEIWVPSRVPVLRPANVASIVAPRHLNGEVPGDAARWMEDSGCRLGLGDGDGVNWVSADQDLSSSLGLAAL
jgi:hypothetical protein